MDADMAELAFCELCSPDPEWAHINAGNVVLRVEHRFRDGHRINALRFMWNLHRYCSACQTVIITALFDQISKMTDIEDHDLDLGRD